MNATDFGYDTAHSTLSALALRAAGSFGGGIALTALLAVFFHR